MTRTSSPLSIEDKLRLVQSFAFYRKFNKAEFYAPYAKQIEFHALGTEKNERLLGAGNQTGKTWCGAHEAAFHATGLYPDNWMGVKFKRHTVGWVGGVSGEVIRDTTQKLLLGRIQDEGAIGSGTIPRDKIRAFARAMGVKDLLDHIKVEHTDGGISLIFFKSYEKGRAKFQGETIDWVWLDEEPPEDVYTECLTRTNKGQNGQFLFMTFTPLLGMTNVAHSFYVKPTKQKGLVMMTIHDVDHYTDEEKQSIIDSYPEHEREARAQGIPILGSGRIFPIAESAIKVDPIPIPRHWARIGGLDFGWDHPQAAASLAWDRDRDIIYLILEYRSRETTPEEAALTLRHWDGIDFAWPHDGYQHDKGSGLQLAAQYKAAGLNMLKEHATHEAGGNGVEAGLTEMLDRMKTGRFKVFSTCVSFFEEFRLYHRKDGKIVKMRDDVICAARYGIMMIRHADTLGMGAPTKIKRSI